MATGVAVLLAQAGVARVAHSQSAGSIGVQVQVVEAFDVVSAVTAVRADEAVRADKALGGSGQPTAGNPILVEVGVPKQGGPGEPGVQRVTVVVL